MAAFSEISQIPLFKYKAIYADPPWQYANWAESGAHKNASSHYDCMDIEGLKNLQVGHVAAKDCALFLWVTDPLLKEGLELMAAWGFEYKTVAFTWAKRTKTDTGWFFGLGYWTRANPEMCLMGTVGKPARLSRGVRQLITSPIREHSRKPERCYSDIENLVEGPYLEMFGRQERPGWDVFGNQTDKFKQGEKL